MLATIKITDQHIADGQRGKCKRCPIALAIREVVRDNVACVVASDSVTLYYAGQMNEMLLPFEAAVFTSRFDSRLPVQPFEFRLPIPPEYLKPSITDEAATQQESEDEVSITDWFDIHDPSDVAAWMHLQEQGVWPKYFMPEHVVLNDGWNQTIASKMAVEYCKMLLYMTSRKTQVKGS